MEKREYGWLLPSSQRASVAMWIESNGIKHGWDKHMQKRIVDRAQQERVLEIRGLVAAVLAFLLVPLGEASAAVGQPCPEHLFVIERSKNANIVVYDANRGPGGDFAASKPVVAYWLLNGEKGKRQELNAVQWQSAYGFDVKPGNASGTFDMAFKADRKRRLTIRTINDCPVLTGSIDGHDAILHKMFVKSNESSIPPKVVYVEFFGEDIATRKPLHEKAVPRK